MTTPEVAGNVASPFTPDSFPANNPAPATPIPSQRGGYDRDRAFAEGWGVFDCGLREDGSRHIELQHLADPPAGARHSLKRIPARAFPQDLSWAAANTKNITRPVISDEQSEEQTVTHGQTEEADHKRHMPSGYTSIPWQRPELMPRQGAARSASHYAHMIAASTEDLPPIISAEALGWMVDLAAPDIVLPERPSSERSYHRSVAVGGLGKVTLATVATLYSRRRIRQDDAERFIRDAVTLADWARGRALRAGLTYEDAKQAAHLSNTLKSVEWGRGHPDAEDGLSIDYAGREAASKAAIAFAQQGPVHASLASMMTDVETSPDLVGGFSMGQFYVRDKDRVQGFQSRGVDRSNPGADLIAPAVWPRILG